MYTRSPISNVPPSPTTMSVVATRDNSCNRSPATNRPELTILGLPHTRHRVPIESALRRNHCARAHAATSADRPNASARCTPARVSHAVRVHRHQHRCFQQRLRRHARPARRCVHHFERVIETGKFPVDDDPDPADRMTGRDQILGTPLTSLPAEESAGRVASQHGSEQHR